jgi:crotonobetainyl-CoA:carnitine CoA-transferase CaiB-like acyl-CoA transferase
VLIENFRPGVMEKRGLGPDRLHTVNPSLVVLRVTGCGQSGPYARRRTSGTLAEAMTGFAHQTGQPDGPATLPPFGLADGVTGLAGAIAVLLALYDRTRNRRPRPAASCQCLHVPGPASLPAPGGQGKQGPSSLTA